MKPTATCAGLIAAAMLWAPGVEAAEEGFDLGKREYQSNCASCHGIGGRGDGVLRGHLVRRPADLTTLARRNDGVFPFQRVYESIDGREKVDPHGSREMPVWGAAYNVKSPDAWPHDAEAYVRSRIIALVDYIYRLQR